MVTACHCRAHWTTLSAWTNCRQFRGFIPHHPSSGGNPASSWGVKFFNSEKTFDSGRRTVAMMNASGSSFRNHGRRTVL
jgi:hypothetical protein